MRNNLTKLLGLGTVVGLTAVACAAPPQLEEGRASTASREEGLSWPNAESNANSDGWIAAHHDQIRTMRPKVLVLNFSNNPGAAANAEAQANRIIAGLAEGSRYHGYADPKAPAFLQYEIAKVVDLADVNPGFLNWTHRTSSHYPIKCVAGAAYQFDYKKLLDDEFASLIGMGAPLGELVATGQVHEVWISLDGGIDPIDCANGVHLNDFQMPESIELKPKYDADGNPIGGFEPCSGNGCMMDDDVAEFSKIGRSLRMVYLNEGRGPGCAVHSLGHSFEWMANNGAVPYLKERGNFKHFGNFDLDTRGAPYSSWYGACATGNDEGCIAYEGNNVATAKDVRFDPLAQGCGNVHFAPNSTKNYDSQNGQEVLATCEHFGMQDGPDGTDLATPYTAAAHAAYDGLLDDCEGGWQVYWRQSFPGRDNAAHDATGGPMKNWWPYLFY